MRLNQVNQLGNQINALTSFMPGDNLGPRISRSLQAPAQQILEFFIGHKIEDC